MWYLVDIFLDEGLAVLDANICVKIGIHGHGVSQE
jgi:hypothetical protein